MRSEKRRQHASAFGFQPPSLATIDRVNNPDTFVIATWNGIPADNSGKRKVMFLTDQMNPMGTMNVWVMWRSDALQFKNAAEAEMSLQAIKLDHPRERARVYPNREVHVMTGGIAGKELT